MKVIFLKEKWEDCSLRRNMLFGILSSFVALKCF